MAARYNARDEHPNKPKPASLGARDPMTARRLKLAMLLFLLLLLLAALPRRASAQAISSMNPEFLNQSADWVPAVEQLSHKVVAITGTNPISITVENSSSIGTQELGEVQRLIDGRLRVAGAQPSAATGAAYAVKIAISENAREFVLAASITQSSGEPAVAVVTAQRSAPEVAGNLVSLRKAFLLRQDLPILDAQLLNPTTLIVLGPDRITIYGKQPGGWQSIATAEIAVHQLPRDARGRLAVRGDSFDAYLPGMVCTSTSLAPLAVGCRDSDDPWPISIESALYNSARNYFTRATGDFADVASKFYSAAFFWQSRTEPHVVFTTADGVLRDGPAGPLPVEAPGWGSDVALLYNSTGAAQNACNGSHLIATASGDYSQPDSLRAFEIHGQKAITASDPLEFPGPVLALWSAPDLTAATVVTHNQKTGGYEAYSVTASCLQ